MAQLYFMDDLMPKFRDAHVHMTIVSSGPAQCTHTVTALGKTQTHIVRFTG